MYSCSWIRGCFPFLYHQSSAVSRSWLGVLPQNDSAGFFPDTTVRQFVCVSQRLAKGHQSTVHFFATYWSLPRFWNPTGKKLASAKTCFAGFVYKAAVCTSARRSCRAPHIPKICRHFSYQPSRLVHPPPRYVTVMFLCSLAWSQVWPAETRNFSLDHRLTSRAGVPLHPLVAFFPHVPSLYTW